MTATDESTRIAPRLTFQLPGRWLAVDPRDRAAASLRIDEVVREVVGTADDAAIARRRLRDQLRTVVERAADASAHALFLCIEIVPDLPTPASLTVHAPAGMRMTPAVGTSADAVLADLMGVEGPKPLAQPLARERDAEWPRKHFRIERQDRSAEGHAFKQTAAPTNRPAP